MTDSPDLMTIVFEALSTPTQVNGQAVYPTNAGARIYLPGDWPTWDGEFPAIKLRIANEDRVSLGRAVVQFTVTPTLQIIAQVEAPASPLDGGAGVAEAELWVLKKQIEVAYIGYPPLLSLIQQYPFVRAEIAYSSEGEYHIANMVLSTGLEFYQGPEDFWQLASSAITGFDVTASNYPPAGVSIPVASGD